MLPATDPISTAIEVEIAEAVWTVGQQIHVIPQDTSIAFGKF